ncbi:DUF5415 family protein, partial [Micrococcus luteus]|uniref:DUF5415 family protein n=1 Tax=Micrococcus luteus TaxID=1270 RepID=UPI003F4D460E
MAGRKKENPVEKAAEKILRNRNIDFNEWKKDIITKKKIAVMSDEDKEWTERTIQEAALQLIIQETLEEESYRSPARSIGTDNCGKEPRRGTSGQPRTRPRAGRALGLLGRRPARRPDRARTPRSRAVPRLR